MRYSLDPGGDNPLPPYQGLRHYWAKLSPVFATAYDAGVADGKTDIANQNRARFDVINSTPSQHRDMLWDAHLDGYRDATRDILGTTALSNGF